jgi:hypothetical protein
MTTDATCPVCDSPTNRVDVPRQHLRVCSLTSCAQIIQVLPDGSRSPISNMLEMNAIGDDRVRSAITTPHITTVRSFLEVYEQAERARALAVAQAVGGLRVVLAQLESRIDSALSAFTGYDLVDDRAGAGLAALREAREFVSVLSSRSRGLPQDEGGGAASA